MNFKRGMFRLWILVSGIWLVCVGSTLVPDAQRYTRPYHLTIEGHEMVIPGTNSRRQVHDDLVSYFRKEPEVSKDPGADAEQISSKFTDEDFYEFLRRALLLLFAPPLVLLVLGRLAIWCAAGFKPTSQGRIA